MIKSAVFVAILFVCLIPGAGVAQQRQQLTGPPEGIERVKLYPEGVPAPGVVEGEDKNNDPTAPTIDIHLPPKDMATGTAVVVLPGGGYGNLAMDHEGKQIGEFFNEHGIAAFVTRYRHAPRYRHPIPMQDAQRAIRYVRANAEKFGIKPDRIGVMGFSAGGHLASTVSTRFEAGKKGAQDPLDRVSSRPDFAILCYPVISFTTAAAHSGSRRNLLGEEPDAKLVESLSSELQVTDKTPPTFLFHTNEDTGVPPENSVLYYIALRQHKVPAEMHIFTPGKHGVGLAPGHEQLEVWPTLLINWMKGMGLVGAVN